MNAGGIGRARGAAEKARGAAGRDYFATASVARAIQNQTSIPTHRVLGEKPPNPRWPEIPELLVVAEKNMARLFNTKTGELSELMTRQEALDAVSPQDL